MSSPVFREMTDCHPSGHALHNSDNCYNMFDTLALVIITDISFVCYYYLFQDLAALPTFLAEIFVIFFIVTG
jgi:hypothetical protein